MQLLKVTRLQGRQSGLITCRAAISACRKGWMAERALQVYEEMRQQRFQPDLIPRHKSDQCMGGWMAGNAGQLLEEMRRHGLQIDELTYTAEVGACGRGWLAEAPGRYLRR